MEALAEYWTSGYWNNATESFHWRTADGDVLINSSQWSDFGFLAGQECVLLTPHDGSIDEHACNDSMPYICEKTTLDSVLSITP